MLANRYRNLLFIVVFINSLYADNLTTKLELSFIETSGNTNTSSLSGKIETNKKINKAEIKAKASIFRSKDNDEESANKYDAELKYDHMLGEKFYIYLGTNFVKDEFSDYDSRLNIGPGLGYKFVNTDKHLIDIQSGFDYSVDKFKDKEQEEYFASRSELNYKYKIKDDIEFKQMISYLKSLKVKERYFITSQTEINIEIIDKLSLGLSYKIDYVNQTEKEKTDKKFLTSIKYEF